MEKFKLQHIVLYAKGWYARTDFWADIKKCLNADGYSSEYFTNKDCRSVILNQFDRLPHHPRRSSINEFINAIDERSCWTYGYFTRNNVYWLKYEQQEQLSDYDQEEAIIRYCLSEFVQLENTEWNTPAKGYVKCLPERKQSSPFVTVKTA